MVQEVKAVMLILENLEMQVIKDNRFKEFSFDSYLREFHLPKTMFKFLQLSQL